MGEAPPGANSDWLLGSGFRLCFSRRAQDARHDWPNRRVGSRVGDQPLERSALRLRQPVVRERGELEDGVIAERWPGAKRR